MSQDCCDDKFHNVNIPIMPGMLLVKQRQPLSIGMISVTSSNINIHRRPSVMSATFQR